MKHIRDLILYLVVGAIATLVEWGCFFVLNQWLHYFLATALAFGLSTLANWFAGRVILFRQTSSPLLKELTQIYMASIIGLVMNLFIMWILVEFPGVSEMLSKIIATGIVFFWNFLVRKLLIYNTTFRFFR